MRLVYELVLVMYGEIEHNLPALRASPATIFSWW